MTNLNKKLKIIGLVRKLIDTDLSYFKIKKQVKTITIGKKKLIFLILNIQKIGNIAFLIVLKVAKQ